MSYYGKHPSLRRAAPPPSDEVWHWFVCNGPHGECFEWVNPVLGAGGELSLLRRFISERAEVIPDFEMYARQIAIEALQSEDASLVLKGIHVLTAIGTEEEMHLLVPLATDSRKAVAKHARTALFERRIRVKRVESAES
ncbi:MAG: hypothetical protein NTV80_07800 [Verrucomicrobia bacterium]|nr:hypothetical protein [Verrucomicrobiota bacterium]